MFDLIETKCDRERKFYLFSERWSIFKREIAWPIILQSCAVFTCGISRASIYFWWSKWTAGASNSHESVIGSNMGTVILCFEWSISGREGCALAKNYLLWCALGAFHCVVLFGLSPAAVYCVQRARDPIEKHFCCNFNRPSNWPSLSFKVRTWIAPRNYQFIRTITTNIHL